MAEENKKTESETAEVTAKLFLVYPHRLERLKKAISELQEALKEFGL